MSVTYVYDTKGSPVPWDSCEKSYEYNSDGTVANITGTFTYLETGQTRTWVQSYTYSSGSVLTDSGLVPQ